MPGPWPQTADELAAAHCLFGVDVLAGQPEVTAFKQRARRQQAWWREQQGLPIGSHTSGKPPVERPNGSRVELEHATATGCNFLSDAIRAAVRHRLDHPEPHQALNRKRLWSDLLSSMPMCFNLFGEVWRDRDRLTATAALLWPGHPGTVSELRFEWSPGRLDAGYLGNRSAFDAAVLLDVGGGKQAALGIETKCHEDIRREAPPDPVTRLPRYVEVTETAGCFVEDWRERLIGTELQQLWLDHLLALSMAQHPSGQWAPARFMVVYPAANPSVARAVERYRAVLADDSTFMARTVEELLDARVLHTPATEAAFRQRYLWA